MADNIEVEHFDLDEELEESFEEVRPSGIMVVLAKHLNSIRT